jgi:hypothetical protein
MDHADQRTTKAYLDPRLSRGINAAEIMSSYLKKPKP